VLRPLTQGRVRINNDGDTFDMLKTRSVQVFDTSAIRPVIFADSTATGIPELLLEIYQG
jgi:hypothetical protein